MLVTHFEACTGRYSRAQNGSGAVMALRCLSAGYRRPSVCSSRSFLLLLAVLLALGARPLLQSLAWGGMLVSYSQEQDFTQALNDTFSGERPCGLCVALQSEARTQPHVLRQQLEQVHIYPCTEWIMKRVPIVISAQTEGLPLTRYTLPKLGWRQAPPVPPPRAV